MYTFPIFGTQHIVFQWLNNPLTSGGWYDKIIFNEWERSDKFRKEVCKWSEAKKMVRKVGVSVCFIPLQSVSFSSRLVKSISLSSVNLTQFVFIPSFQTLLKNR